MSRARQNRSMDRPAAKSVAIARWRRLRLRSGTAADETPRPLPFRQLQLDAAVALLGAVRGGDVGAAFRQQERLSGVEKHFRLEYEAVADDPYIRPVAENGAQPPEEFRTVAR